MKRTPLLWLVSLACSTFALQGGPVQPDYVQFEPSGKTDMVDLLTGDFSYQVPLGDLPSPYGNYPLSVSYRAGISPQQEASWVGLGWSLNPGVINRSVRGVPDDQFHGGTLGFIYQYSGMQTWNVNMSFGAGPFGLGMNYSKGGSVGYSAILGLKAGSAVVGFTMSTDGTVGIEASAQAGVAKVSTGVSYSLKDGTPMASAGAQLFPAQRAEGQVGFGGSLASVGMTVSPNGVTTSASAGPLSVRKSKDGVCVSVKGGPLTVSNSVTSKGQTKTKTAGLSLYATDGFLHGSLGYSQTTSQYWLRSATSDYVYGYMYQAGPSIDVGQENDFEMSPNASAGTYNHGKRKMPWKWSIKGRSLEVLGERNMLPAYDIYSVASEGISGSFRPFARETHQMYRLTSDLYIKNESYSFLLNETTSNSRIKQNEEEFIYSGNEFKENEDGKFNDYRYCVLKDKACSPYGLYQTNYRNIGNRLVYNSNEDEFEERGGMRFMFIGSHGGYYESDSVGKSSSYKRSEISELLLKRTIGDQPNSAFDYALYGSKKIEPIFEDNSQTGKLEGFVITIEDGTKYYFKQPVRSYLKVDYSINQSMGVPLFVDKNKDVEEDLLVNMLTRVKAATGKVIEDILTNSTVPIYLQNWWNSSTLEKLTGVAAVTSAWGAIKEPFKKIGKMFEGHLDETCKAGESYDELIYTSAVNLNPYATQWLLTEIRGADFVKLGDKMEDNVGYNIKFHYTKPSMYKWRTPYARPGLADGQLPNLKIPRSAYTPVGCNAEKYQATFGLKEIVYLDSIESSTHLIKFKLNEKERVDGKGWNTDVTFLPIMVQASIGYKRNKNSDAFLAKYIYFNSPLTEAMENKLYQAKGLFVYQSDLDDRTVTIGEKDYKVSVKKWSEVFENNSTKIVQNSYKKTTGDEGKYGLYRVEIESHASMMSVKGNELPSADSIIVVGVDGHIKDVPYINWTDVVFPKKLDFFDSHENQMRYLEKISYFSKKDRKNPYREFIFGYDYSLQPKTLNSYCNYITVDGKKISGYPLPDRNDQIVDSPDSVGIDVCENATKQALYGKLTLRSITEKGCQNNKCASLPPFRFDYLSPNASPIRFGKASEWKNLLVRIKYFFDDYGKVNSSTSNEEQYKYFGDVDATIMATTNTVDEYGLWSSKATVDNHSVDQKLADFQGSAWSLNKVVDPAGGVTEVEYERDVIGHGEYYGDDYLTVKVLQFFSCEDEGYTGSNGGTCLVLQPLYWRNSCLGVREAYWDTKKPEGDNTDGYAYLNALGITGDNPPTVFFNIVSGIKTEVDCGLSECPRERETSVVGSGDVVKVVQYKGGEDKKVLMLKTPYNSVYVGMQRAADKINTSQTWKVNPIAYGSYGTIWVRQELPKMKAGDLRVTRLTRHDINVNAQTNYEYEIGETAQLADSLYTSAMVNRYYKSVNSYVLSGVNLQPISRIVGFNDKEMDIVPGPQVMYPKVSVTNSWQNESDAKNGRVEFSYITPESGVPADFIDAQTKNEMPPFLKLNLKLMKSHGDEVSNSALAFPLFSQAGRVVTISLLDKDGNVIDEPRTTMLTENRTGELYFYSQDIKNAVKIRVNEMKGSETIWSHRDMDIDTVSLTSFNEMMIELVVGYVSTERPSPKLVWFRSQKEGMYPILYKKVDYGKKNLTRKMSYLYAMTREPNHRVDMHALADYDSSVTYYDLTGFVGLNYKTSFYRGGKDSEIPIKVDSVVYSTMIPDYADSVITNKTSLSSEEIQKKIGSQVEHWTSVAQLDCKKTETNDLFTSCLIGNIDLDAWDDGRLETYYTHVRKSAFQVATITKTGYDNFNNDQESLLATTKLENHAFDPATGSPTVTVAIGNRENQQEMQKLTRITPFFSLDKKLLSGESQENADKRAALADSMFVRNMLSQSYMTEIYSGTVSRGSPWKNLQANTDSLRSFSISPYGFVEKQNSEQTSTPIVSWGTFTSKAKPSDIYSKALMYAAKNGEKPPVADYSGNEIVSINKNYKVTETIDPLGRSLSSFFSWDGMFQIGLFFPARNEDAGLVVPYQDTVLANGICSFSGEFEVKDGVILAKENLTISYRSSTPTRPLVVEYRLWASEKGWETKRENVPFGADNLSLSVPFNGKLNYFRIYPETAQAKTYIYDVYGNMVQVVAEDNTSTYYEYDPLSHLVQTRNDDGVSFKSHHREWMNNEEE